MLDRLSSHVETGNLQTVVDKVNLPSYYREFMLLHMLLFYLLFKVYSLQDFELALAHACSMGAIGCTVVRLS